MPNPRLALAAAALAGLAACATAPTPAPQRQPVPPAAPAQPSFRLEPVPFSALPGWTSADLTAGLYAFQRQCQAWSRLAPAAPISRGAAYGGLVGDWAGPCAAAWGAGPESARSFFEAHFQPQRVLGGGQAKLTGYYEPAIEARRAPEPGFSEPLLPRPEDMVTIDLRAFAERLESEALKQAPRTVTGRVAEGRVTPFPERSAIARAPYPPIAWAHPADVYNLQVQGSGRLLFPDGAQTRAAFAAQNGFRWRSAIAALRDQGRLPAHPDGVWAAFRAFVDANPGEARAALDLDPSYVFFEEQPIEEPGAGPKGAAGVPLTGLGSIAVDPAFHPYGAPLFVSADTPLLPRLLVAQDTGGAIRRGPLRGDVFLGTGADAGAWAVQLNADAPAFFVLLPRAALVAESAAVPRS